MLLIQSAEWRETLEDVAKFNGGQFQQIAVKVLRAWRGYFIGIEKQPETLRMFDRFHSQQLDCIRMRFVVRTIRGRIRRVDRQK